MTADARGAFHPIWPDARSGTWQAYTARIRVLSEDESIRTRLADTERESVSLAGKAGVRFIEAHVDSGTLDLTLWARIQNLSSDTLYGPFSAEIVGFGEGDRKWYGTPSLEGATNPVRNASNGKKGVGARFVYEGKAGNVEFLPPGAVTEPMPWRLRASANRRMQFELRTLVRGFQPKTH